MQIKCPSCGNIGEVDVEPTIGQHLVCPFCSEKFSYSGVVQESENEQSFEDSSSAQVKKASSIRSKVIVGGIATTLLIALILGTCVSGNHVNQLKEKDSKSQCQLLNQKTNKNAKAVDTSIKCLLKYLGSPTERRMQSLSKSLESCPEDFQNAVKEFLVATTLTSDDMISKSERDDVLAGAVVLSMLCGVAADSRQDAFTSGMQIGNMMQAELQKKAKKRLKEKIETKRSNLIDIAEKYGANPDDLESALLGFGW